MSRGDPEVGQLLALVTSSIFINSTQSLQRSGSAQTVYSAHRGPALRLNVKQPPRAAMLIRAIASDCLVYVHVRGSYAVTGTRVTA